MLSLDDARGRHEALAALHATAIDACRRAADACAQLMLRHVGDNADAHLRLAMDALCETVALGCATAFERDASGGDATAQACRECARACRALRTSVAPVRMHGVAA